jgi:citrate lyase subunit beta/citryl-CoA lyase
MRHFRHGRLFGEPGDGGAFGGRQRLSGRHLVLSEVQARARRARIDPVDGPYGNYKNPDQYRKEATLGSIVGCVGKWAIHPSQIDIALDVFTPKRDAVEAARHLSSEYAKAEAAGLGAVSIDGIMVDAATVRMMKNTLDKADLIGM